jgi:poly(hydroxyalkanoate) depolymerase family esterase
MKMTSICVSMIVLLFTAAAGATPSGSSSIPTASGCIPFVTCGSGASDTSAQSLPGKWQYNTFKNAFGVRNYYLYVPQSYSGRPIPLMVMLHGCMQSAPEFALETGMNWMAEKYGFAVLYPEQGYQDNIFRCWNWFYPENQGRTGGEPGIVLGMMNQISRKISIDTHHVYVAGMSSGAAMAANLLACHSDVFAGAGLVAGVEYAAATSQMEANNVMTGGSNHDLQQTALQAVKCSGASARMSAVIAIYGSHDTTVNPINSSHVIQQFSAINDLLDDGRPNQSQNDRVILSRVSQVPKGYSYKSDYYGGNGAIRLLKVEVEGMGHAWSGTLSPGQFADPNGPNGAEMIWQFLSTTGSL